MQLFSTSPAQSTTQRNLQPVCAANAQGKRVGKAPAPQTTKLFKSLAQPHQEPHALVWSKPGDKTPGSELPSQIPQGDLLINGVGAFEQYGTPIAHWFDGPGFVQRFALRHANSSHAYRRVDAPENKLERLINRPIKGAMNTPPKGGFLGNALFGLRNPCNTNVIVTPGGEIQGRFEAYPPTHIDGDNLQAGGAQHFNGVLPSGAHLSAHPARHVDGSLWDFCLDQMAQTITLYRIGTDDKMQQHVEVTMPYNGFIHDIVATKNYVVALLSPMVYPSPPTELPVWARRSIVKTAAAFMTKTPMDVIKWEPKLGTYIGLFGLGEDKTVQWLKSPKTFFNFHVANAFETVDGSITLDASIYDDAAFMWAAAHDMQHRAVHAKPARMARLHIDKTRGVQLHETQHLLELTDTAASVRGIKSGPFCGLTYKDTVAGVPAFYDPSQEQLRVCELGQGDYASTPIMLNDDMFATVVSNVERGDSALHIYDMATLGTKTPIATAKLPVQLPPTFHGTFVPTQANT